MLIYAVDNIELLHTQLDAFDESLLSQQDQLRLTNIKLAKRRYEFLAGRLLVQQLYAEINPQAVMQAILRNADNGAPQLSLRYSDQRVEQSELQISIAHSHGWAAVAISDQAVGIDIEVSNSKRELLRLANSVLSADELANFQLQQGSKQVQLFYQYWTLKESWFKRSQQGIAPARLATIQSVPANIKTANALSLHNEQYSVALVSELISSLQQPANPSMAGLSEQYWRIESIS